jgi:flagellar hook-basal body complex protein FliE
MSVSGIEATGFSPMAAPRIEATSGVKGAAGPDGAQEFGNLVLDGIDRLEAVQGRSDQLAVQAATGDLAAIHQYTMAASEAAVTTQLTVAVRNKAVEAFNEIMRMPV